MLPAATRQATRILEERLMKTEDAADQLRRTLAEIARLAAGTPALEAAPQPMQQPARGRERTVRRAHLQVTNAPVTTQGWKNLLVQHSPHFEYPH